jgi:hypothetical protein
MKNWVSVMKDMALDKQVTELDDRTADSLNDAILEIGEHNFL